VWISCGKINREFLILFLFYLFLIWKAVVDPGYKVDNNVLEVGNCGKVVDN